MPKMQEEIGCGLAIFLILCGIAILITALHFAGVDLNTAFFKR